MDQLKVKDRILENISLSVKKVSGELLVHSPKRGQKYSEDFQDA